MKNRRKSPAVLFLLWAALLFSSCKLVIGLHTPELPDGEEDAGQDPGEDVGDEADLPDAQDHVDLDSAVDADLDGERDDPEILQDPDEAGEDIPYERPEDVGMEESEPEEGLVVLYTFEEGTGTAVHDVSGVGDPLDLTIADPGGTAWISGGLSVNASTILSHAAAPAKLVEMCTASNAITIEAWIKPGDNSAATNFPLRIVTFSFDPTNRNFTWARVPERVIRAPCTS
jgi:hypothetical protein